MITARNSREQNFTHPVMVHALFEDAAIQMKAGGADETFLTMTSTGMDFAERASARLKPQ